MRDVTHLVRQIPIISHFLNFGRKRSCAVMSGFVQNAISRLIVPSDNSFYSHVLFLLRLLPSANICKIRLRILVKFIGPLIGSFIGSFIGPLIGPLIGSFSGRHRTRNA